MSKRIERFKLTRAESEMALWQKIRAHYEKRLDVLRRKNDGDLSPEETARIRGRIAEVKGMLGLEAPANTDTTERP